MIARRIQSLEPASTSVVFGLVGPWGSGKSTIVNMVLETMEEPWLTATFAPWAATGSGGLVLEFFRTVDAVLGGRHAKFAAAKRAVRDYGGWGAPLFKLVPGVGGTLAGVAQKGLDKLVEEGPWSRRFDQASAALKKLQKQILIVCDDIDRLDAVELLEFLKVVRLLGRFPNIHYLVAYDQNTVEDLLRSQRVAGRLTNFMEKIVQHPFEVPPISEARRLGLASETVDLLRGRVPRQLTSSDDARAADLTAIIARSLTTPRAQFRYRHQLDAYADLVAFDEVDFLDFAALSLLRLHYHDVYEAVPGLAADLQRGLRLDGEAGESDALTRHGLRARFQQWCGEDRAQGAWDLVGFLFPGAYDGKLAPLHRRAFADVDYLARYYHLGIPPHDIADATVARGLEQVVSHNRGRSIAVELASAMDSSEQERARLAFSKAGEERRRGAQGSRALIEFLGDRLAHRADEADEFGTALSALTRWAVREVTLAYRDREISRDHLLRLFDETTTYDLLFRTYEVESSPDEVDPVGARRMRDDFAELFLDELASPHLGDIGTDKHLRGKLMTIAASLGVDKVRAMLEERIRRRPEDATAIARAMVRIRRWRERGIEQTELSFDSALWESSLSAAFRETMTGRFDMVDLAGLDRRDASDANITRFATAMVADLERSSKE